MKKVLVRLLAFIAGILAWFYTFDIFKPAVMRVADLIGF